MTDYRVEYRLHDWATPAKDSKLFALGGTAAAPFLVFLLTTSNELCALDYADSAPDYGGEMCADITGVPDVVVRFQRDTTNLKLNYEVRTVASTPLVTYCGLKKWAPNNTFPCPMRKTSTASWAGTSEIGDQNSVANAQLAWIKWYSTLVPSGSGALVSYTPADLADWRFNGDFSEAATGAVATIQGQPPLAATPVYPPACSAGLRLTFRAGHPAQLDGTASYPLDGGSALTYAWTEVSGPSRVSWSGRNTAQPNVSRLVFGSYVFQLTVTDGSLQSTSCSIKHGAVASDDNGVVITNNPALDVLIGPQIRFGASPWPWFDDRHRGAADLQSRNLDVYYTSYWDTPAPGTITVTPGSRTVTGVGTTFTTTFCQGPDNPNTVKIGTIGLVAWHPTATAGITGRRWIDVASCQSDTQLTTVEIWTADLAGGTMAYSYAGNDNASTWIANVDPANFYDNVVGFYTLYYRSGIDDYLVAARKLADRFWASPRMDYGAACEVGSGFCTFPRNISQLGMVLRAIDGRPDMWPGLRAMWAKFAYNLGYLWIANEVQDAREEGYELAMVAYCGLVDPDATGRAACKKAISGSFPTAWTPFMQDGSWPTLWYGGTKFSSWDTKTAVTLTQGSATVTGNGTAWTADLFPNNGTSTVWFTNSGSVPASNVAGDPTWYTATFVDGTHITLDRPYEGSSGTHGWALGGTVQPLGWGQEPFILGILATAFDLAAKAVEDTDPATAALAHGYNVAAVNWLRTQAYWANMKALYYQAAEINCQAPVSDSNTVCTGGNGVAAARTLNAMIMRAIGAAYAYSGDPALKDYGDTLFSAMYSKPGTGGPNPDGSYVSSLDDASGYYMVGAPPLGSAPKYFGMFFGFGDNSSWPAYRLGLPSPPSTHTVQISTAHPPGAASMRVTVTEPSGAVTQMYCGLTHCAATVDGRQGEPAISVEYLSPANQVMAAEPGSILRAPGR